MKLAELEKVVRRSCTVCKRKLGWKSLKQNKISSKSKLCPAEAPVEISLFKRNAVYPIVATMGPIVTTPMMKTFGLKIRDKSGFDFKEHQVCDLDQQQYEMDYEKEPQSYLNCKSDENLAMDFFKHTSLHGLKYIGERKQHLVER
jgi:hypothetical protein